MNLQPHHVGLVVSDLAPSTAFYEALGFRIVSDSPAEDSSRTVRFLSLGAFQLELFWYAEPAMPQPSAAPAGKGRLGFRHLALQTNDIEAALAELKSAGMAPADLEIRVLPMGYKLVFLTDPDGVEIELMQEA